MTKKANYLAEAIEIGDVSLPPEKDQRQAALALASVSSGPAELAETLRMVGLLEDEAAPVRVCEKGHRLDAKGRCRKCERNTCKRGHEYTPENTRITTHGQRKCLICYQKWLVAHRERRRLPCSWCGGPKEGGDRHLCGKCRALRDGD